MSIYSGPDRRQQIVPVPCERRHRPSPSPELPRREKGVNWLMLGMAAVIAGLAGLVGFLAVTNSETPPFDPFSYDSVWSIHIDGERPAINGWDSPAIYWDQEIRVSGVRCNSSADNLTSKVSVWWDRVDRADTGRIAVVDGIEVLVEAGCEPIGFDLEVPAELAIGLADDEVGAQRWKIVGTSRPDRDGGVVAVWESEPVWIVARTMDNPHATGG